MKAVIVNMDHSKKGLIKPHNLCKFQQVDTTVQISIARPEDSIIRSKVFILTKIDFHLFRKAKPRQCKRPGFIVVHKSMRNSKEPWQKSLLLIIFQVDVVTFIALGEQ